MIKQDERSIREVSYEGKLAEKIMEVLAGEGITKRFRVKLEEEITHFSNYTQYHHDLDTRIYSMQDGFGEQPSSTSLAPIMGHWYNEDQEPLAQIFLKGTIRYLQKYYQETLIKNNVAFSEPSLPRARKGRYTSEFFITAI